MHLFSNNAGRTSCRTPSRPLPTEDILFGRCLEERTWTVLLESTHNTMRFRTIKVYIRMTLLKYHKYYEIPYDTVITKRRLPSPFLPFRLVNHILLPRYPACTPRLANDTPDATHTADGRSPSVD